jgi:hypothetical protein
MSRIRNPGFYILFMHLTVSCIVVDWHSFHAGSGAFHFNGDPDPDPTLFYICWKIRMAFFYSQGTTVKDYTILSLLVSVVDIDIFSILEIWTGQQNFLVSGKSII